MQRVAERGDEDAGAAELAIAADERSPSVLIVHELDRRAGGGGDRVGDGLRLGQRQLLARVPSRRVGT